MRFLLKVFLFALVAALFSATGTAQKPKLDSEIQSQTTEAPTTENQIVAVTPENQREDGVRIRGKVLTFDGKPVPDATIQLNRREPSMGGFHGTFVDVQTDVVTTNEAGEYEFAGVDPSWPYQIVARTRIAPDGILMIPDDSSLSRGDKPYDITLKQPVTVRGVVTDEEDQPLSDVLVSSRTHTDAEGRFSIIFAVDAKEYQVNLYRKGYVRAYLDTTPEELNGQEWKLMMYRPASLAATGRATFVDGMPVSNAKLELKLTPVNEAERTHERRIDGQTDDDGNFTITLPQPLRLRYTGVAKAVENRNDGARQWSCDIQDMELGQPLKLQFDNRGQIHVDVRKTKLPDGYKFSISCYLVKSNRWMMNVELSDNESNLVLTGLEPGEYRVYIRVPKLSNKSWSEEVTIPDMAPYQGRVTLAPPQFETGDIKATFLMPDGKTPASELSVYIEGVGAGRSAKSNAKGELYVKDLMAGSLFMSPRHASGEVAEVGNGGHKVIAGQETDLGTIRLKSVDEEFGWFEGTLTYDDGVAVPVMFNGGTGFVSGPGIGLRIKGDGQFRQQLRRGKQNVVFVFRDKAIATFPLTSPARPLEYSTMAQSSSAASVPANTICK